MSLYYVILFRSYPYKTLAAHDFHLSQGEYREGCRPATPGVTVSRVSRQSGAIESRFDSGAPISVQLPEGRGNGVWIAATKKMEIRISKESEVPLRQQLAENIIYLIATGQVKAGEPLPSVRELARRLKIHRNTVSEAYQDLVARTWLVGRRGSRLVVRSAGKESQSQSKEDLDDLINRTIHAARDQGYSMQQLRERVRERLLFEPPDHFIVVEEEPGLRSVLAEEIRTSLRWPAEGCSRQELMLNPGLAIGALAAVPEYAAADAVSLVPKDRPAVSISFSTADEHLKRVRQLRHPSVIVVISVSKVFLQTARGLLARELEGRHTMLELLLPLDSPDGLKAADLIFADSVALGTVQHPKAIHYRLISQDSLDYLATAMGSYRLR
jgi:DNA-binding transcriptional regulator YhcF (GntR family)